MQVGLLTLFHRLCHVLYNWKHEKNNLESSIYYQSHPEAKQVYSACWFIFWFSKSTYEKAVRVTIF